jgi:hypothetical protein
MAASRQSMAAPSIESLDNEATEKQSPTVFSNYSPTSQNLPSRSPSHESITTPTRRGIYSDLPPFRHARRLSATPSAHDERRPSLSAREPIREKSATTSLSSLSDYNGSEASHTERRFIRHWEELDSHATGPPPK